MSVTIPPSASTSLDRAARREKARAFQIEMAEKRAKAIELRRAGQTYAMIGEALGCSEQHAHRLVKNALATIVSDPAQALIEREVRALEDLEKRLMRFLDVIHPVIQGGRVVTDTVMDAAGLPVIDPRTGEPMQMPVHNVKTTLAVMSQLQAVHESRRKLLGLDKPTKVAAVTPDGKAAAAPMDEERLAAVLEMITQRNTRKVVDMGPIDVKPVDKSPDFGEKTTN